MGTSETGRRKIHLHDLETPSVVVDYDRLTSNITRLAEYARKQDVHLRPHIKTHKCIELAQLQIEAGAVGITASKVDEALPFIETGITSVTLAYPLIDSSKIERLLHAAEKHTVELRVLADSFEGVEALARSAARHSTQLDVFLKVDVGLHRCGLEEDSPDLIPLVQQIVSNPHLRFVGLLSHAGQVYGARDAAHAREIAAQEREIMGRVHHTLSNNGIEVPEVSVGSTPTILASADLTGITEIRAGNYVFMDRTPLRLNLITPEEVALTILASIVSKNADYFIIDAGSKVFSSDKGAHGIDGTEGYGLAYPVEYFQQAEHELVVQWLSEEHGAVTRAATDLPLGSKLKIIPNHSCPAVNLTDHITVTSEDYVRTTWPVAARGKVR